jgi:hypothetical protein
MGSASELGSMQFRTDMLHDLGYGMPRNIDPFNLMDPTFSRNLADQFIKGYSKHHSFDTPIEKLIAYNMGAQGAADWKARGSNFDELPQTTKNYIRKALSFANNQPTEQNNMLQYGAMQRMSDKTTPETLKQEGTAAPAGTLKANSMNNTTNPTLLDSGFMQRHAAQLQLQQPIPENSPFFPTVPDAVLNNTDTFGADIYPPQAALTQQRVEPNPYTMAEMAAGTIPKPALSNGLEANDDFPSFIETANAQTLNPAEPVLSRDPMPDGLITTSSPKTMSTDQARKQTPFSLPDQRIGRDEALIRIGGAMMGGSQQGGLAAFQAATNQYGSIQDYNRSQALDAYNASVKAAGKQAANPNADASSAYQQSTINSIDEIVGLVDQTANNMNPFDNVAGLFGSLKSMFPGNNAYDVDKMLNTIKANVGFDRLQAMRDSSPTGGALGQVTELELKLLQSSLAALDQGMSPERFREQLMIVRDQYIKVTGLLAQDPALQGGMGGLSVQVSPNVTAARNIVGNK